MCGGVHGNHEGDHGQLFLLQGVLDAPARMYTQTTNNKHREQTSHRQTKNNRQRGWTIDADNRHRQYVDSASIATHASMLKAACASALHACRARSLRLPGWARSPRRQLEEARAPLPASSCASMSVFRLMMSRLHYAPVCCRVICASLMSWCYTPATCLNVGQCYATGWLLMVSKSEFKTFPATRPRLVRSSQTRTAVFSPTLCSH